MVEMISFGTPTGSACIAGATSAAAPEDIRARLHEKRESLCHGRNSLAPVARGDLSGKMRRMGGDLGGGNIRIGMRTTRRKIRKLHRNARSSDNVADEGEFHALGVERARHENEGLSPCPVFVHRTCRHDR
jgi:hypothetical protein